MASKFKISDLPKGDFHLSQIADEYYPECVKSDSQGRTYNMASSTISRVLRRMEGVMELENGYFYNAT